MNINSLPIVTNPTVSDTNIGTAVMAKTLDVAEVSGQSLIKMMELSVNPNLGANIDLSI